MEKPGKTCQRLVAALERLVAEEQCVARTGEIEKISTVQQRGEMCMVRQNLMPLFRLHRLFNIKPRTEIPAEALVVIVRDNERQCCVLVDELLGQQQVVIKSLGEGIGNVRGISGGAILGDGNVCLILDVPGIIDLASTN